MTAARYICWCVLLGHDWSLAATSSGSNWLSYYVQMESTLGRGRPLEGRSCTGWRDRPTLAAESLYAGQRGRPNYGDLSDTTNLVYIIAQVLPLTETTREIAKKVQQY
ncbi:hypothetical protein DFH29DRAFT_1071176 [Suillus ampliporus]|nr:hypothetical protein DFH29DRAFT_1071176 [Suillus ampliporus]